MNLTLDKDTQRFIDEEVKSGRFPNAEAVVHAAIADWREMNPEVDEEIIAVLNNAEAQADRGEGMELEAFRQKFNKSRFAK